MAQLAQAYFHFKTDMRPTELQEFGRRVRDVSRIAALRNFDIEVRVDVDIEEGSLKGRITVVGALLLSGTSLIANYKGVKDSVIEICQDARSFGGDVCGRAIELAGVSKRQVYRTERRTKTAGKLGRLLSDIERLEKSVSELSPIQMKEELGRFNRELQAIANDLQAEERRALGSVLEDTKLPPPRKWPTNHAEPSRIANREEQTELFIPEEQVNGRNRRHSRYRASLKVKPKGKKRRRRSPESFLHEVTKPEFEPPETL